MGTDIPFYLQALVDTAPAVHQAPCHVLCLDMTPVIHQAASQAALERRLLSEQQLHDVIIQGVLGRLECLVRMIQPQQLVYIAMDGVAPLAKMHHQRRQRYMAAQQGSWDSNCVTPGTAFMDALDARLRHFVNMQKNGASCLHWVLSSVHEPGEGAHKMFRFLKSASLGQGSQVCIHGIDAHLVLLSLLCVDSLNHNGVHVNLLSNDTVLQINPLRQAVTSLYGITVPEYVFLCSFLGNDFLPPLSHFSVHSTSMTSLVAAYRKASALIGQTLVLWTAPCQAAGS